MSKPRSWLCAMALLLVAVPAGADEALREARAALRRGLRGPGLARMAEHLRQAKRRLPESVADGMAYALALGHEELSGGRLAGHEPALVVAQRMVTAASTPADRARAWLLVAALRQRPRLASELDDEAWPVGLRRLLALAACRQVVELLRDVPGDEAYGLLRAAADAACRARAGLAEDFDVLDDVARTRVLAAIEAGRPPSTSRCWPLEQLLVVLDAVGRRPECQPATREQLAWARGLHLAATSDAFPRPVAARERLVARLALAEPALRGRAQRMGAGKRWQGRRGRYLLAQRARIQLAQARRRFAEAEAISDAVRERLGVRLGTWRPRLRLGERAGSLLYLPADRAVWLTVEGPLRGPTELELRVAGGRLLHRERGRDHGYVARFKLPALAPGRYEVTLRRGVVVDEARVHATPLGFMMIGGDKTVRIRSLDARGAPLRGTLRYRAEPSRPTNGQGFALWPVGSEPRTLVAKAGELSLPRGYRSEFRPVSLAWPRNPERIRPPEARAGEAPRLERLLLWDSKAKRPVAPGILHARTLAMRVGHAGVLLRHGARAVPGGGNSPLGPRDWVDQNAVRLDATPPSQDGYQLHLQRDPLDFERGRWQARAAAIVAPGTSWRVRLRPLDGAGRPLAGRRVVYCLNARPRRHTPRHHPSHPLDGLFEPGFGTRHQASPPVARDERSYDPRASLAGMGRTDRDGWLELQLPSDVAGNDLDLVLTLRAAVIGEGGRVLGRTQVHAVSTRRPRRLGIEHPGRLAEGERLTARVELVDVVGRRLRGVQRVAVRVLACGAGAARQVDRLELTLRDGVGTLRWSPPRAGAYRLVATAPGAQRGLELIVASPGRRAPLPPAPRLHMPLARRLHGPKPLELLVRAPFERGTVWLALTGRGEVVAHRLVTIERYQGWARMPPPGDRGRLTLSALAWHDGFILRSQRHLYTRPARLLTTEVSLNARVAGEPATVGVVVRDRSGRPRPDASVLISVQSQPDRPRLAPWDPEPLRVIDDPRQLLEQCRGRWNPPARGLPNRWPEERGYEAVRRGPERDDAALLAAVAISGRRSTNPAASIPWSPGFEEPAEHGWWPIEPLEPDDRLPVWAPDDPAQPATTLLWRPRLRPDAAGRLRGRFRWPGRPGTWIVRVTAVTPDGFVGHRRLVVRTGR